MPGGVHVANTNRYRHPLGDDEKAFMLAVTDAIEEAIVFEGPETVAAVYPRAGAERGRLLRPARRATSQRVREICDRYGVLLVSDEVICAFGRLGYMFGAERYDYLPDIITVREGPHERLLAARRGDLPRLPRRAVPRGQGVVRCTASPSAVIR